MNTLYRRNKAVAAMAEDGTVYSPVSGKKGTLGHVSPDGIVTNHVGEQLGWVEPSGSIFDALGSRVGAVDERGAVTEGHSPFGSVDGTDPYRAGAALLLLFRLPPPPPPDSPPIIPDNVSWIFWLILGGILVTAILFALIVVVITSFIWGVMALLSVASALYLATTLGNACTDAEIADFGTAQRATKRGFKTCIAEEHLRSIIKPYPFLLLVSTLPLCYGIIISAVSLYLMTSNDGSSNLAIMGGAFLAGAVVSVLVGNKVLHSKLNTVLLARKDLLSSGGIISGTGISYTSRNPSPDWDRIAGYAGGLIGLTLLIGVVSVGWRFQSFTPAPRAGNINVGQGPDARLPNQETPPESVISQTGESAPEASSSVSRSLYEGNTGSKKAVFELNWDRTSKRVEGQYYTLERPDRRYMLKGTNSKEGELILEEFTDGTVSATIQLKKKAVGRTISWTGIMHNTDGRKIPVNLSRTVARE